MGRVSRHHEVLRALVPLGLFTTTVTAATALLAVSQSRSWAAPVAALLALVGAIVALSWWVVRADRAAIVAFPATSLLPPTAREGR